MSVSQSRCGKGHALQPHAEQNAQKSCCACNAFFKTDNASLFCRSCKLDVCARCIHRVCAKGHLLRRKSHVFVSYECADCHTNCKGDSNRCSNCHYDLCMGCFHEKYRTPATHQPPPPQQQGALPDRVKRLCDEYNARGSDLSTGMAVTKSLLKKVLELGNEVVPRPFNVLVSTALTAIELADNAVANKSECLRLAGRLARINFVVLELATLDKPTASVQSCAEELTNLFNRAVQLVNTFQLRQNSPGPS
jgi:hypothetical protein